MARNRSSSRKDRSRKCEQLARDVSNILVIEMNSIDASVPEWANAIRSILTPGKNRRLGAVVLYQSLFSARIDRGFRLWWVIENPHALRKIPADTLAAFASFDERRHLEPR